MRLLPLILLSACVTEANFGASAAQASCARSETCDPNAFNAAFDDVGECVDAFDDLFGGECWQENCTFDVVNANTCVAALRTADCDGNSPVDNPDCDDVWTDCNVIGLTACGIGLD